jgi:hypothetical protein
VVPTIAYVSGSRSAADLSTGTFKAPSPISAAKLTCSPLPRIATAPSRVSRSFTWRRSCVAASVNNRARAVAAACLIYTPATMIPVLPPVDP